MGASASRSVPTSVPFGEAAFVGLPMEYGGAEAVGTGVTAATLVDWVLVEARSEPTGAAVSRAAGLLRRDGKVVDPDGVSPLRLPGLAPGSYHVVVRHRNHLPVMSAAPVDLSDGYASYDFTAALSQAYTRGGAAMVGLGTGGAAPFALWAGDGDLDGRVLASDYQGVWRALSGQEGYLLGDFDLDGRVLASDYQEVWRPNAGVAESQVPEPGEAGAAAPSDVGGRRQEVRVD